MYNILRNRAIFSYSHTHRNKKLIFLTSLCFSDQPLSRFPSVSSMTSLSLSRFLAALKDGGSCSSVIASRSTFMNSSKVKSEVGVSPNSLSRFLKVLSWTLTTLMTSETLRLKLYRRLAIRSAAPQRPEIFLSYHWKVLPACLYVSWNSNIKVTFCLFPIWSLHLKLANLT